jgi:hypothetical protein
MKNKKLPQKAVPHKDIFPDRFNACRVFSRCQLSPTPTFQLNYLIVGDRINTPIFLDLWGNNL